jgi:exopolysaccharide biosynthesis polyprenyl glycosylphosphotransferase
VSQFTHTSSSNRPGAAREAEEGFPWAYVDPFEFARSLGVEAEPRRITRRAWRDVPGSPVRWLGISDGPGPTDAAKRRGLFARLLALADALAATCGILLLGLLSGHGFEAGVLLLVPLVVVVGKIVGLYDRDDAVIRRSTLDEAPALFQLATVTTLGGWIVAGLVSHRTFEAGAVLGAWLGFFVLLLGLRAAARRGARRIAPEDRVLFVGDRESYDRFRAKLPEDNRIGVRLLGRVALRAVDAQPDTLGTAAELPALVGRHDVHRVVVVGSSDHRELLDIVRLMKLLGVQVSLLPILLDVVGSSVEFEDLRGLHLMGVRSFGLSRSSRVVKRTMDLLGAALGLTLLSPVFAGVALAVRLDSRGPIFFRQTRVGRNGRSFGMFKFRSMSEDADAHKEELRHLNETEGFFKITDDPRITRVGRWLRRTSVDEMPQLINVLRGEMSLVGPRPLVLDDDERVHGWHRQRLHLTPGMTGPWQVLGSSRVPLDEMVKIDYLYVANWSLWNDVKLMLRTVPVVVGLRGL